MKRHFKLRLSERDAVILRNTLRATVYAATKCELTPQMLEEVDTLRWIARQLEGAEKAPPKRNDDILSGTITIDGSLLAK